MPASTPRRAHIVIMPSNARIHFSTGSHGSAPRLDFEAMNAAAAMLTEVSDFASFAKLHSDARTTICRVSHARWTPVEAHPRRMGFRDHGRPVSAQYGARCGRNACGSGARQTIARRICPRGRARPMCRRHLHASASALSMGRDLSLFRRIHSKIHKPMKHYHLISLSLSLLLAYTAATAAAEEPLPDRVSCTSIMVGRKASADGSVITSHTCDGNYRTWMDIVPAARYERDTTVTVVSGRMHTDHSTGARGIRVLDTIPQLLPHLCFPQHCISVP